MQQHSRARLLMPILLVLLFSTSAHSSIMTFDGLDLNEQTSAPYVENGLIATPPDFGGVIYSYNLPGVAHLDPDGAFNNTIEFTHQSGVFSLLSVDILSSDGMGANNGLWEAFSGGVLLASATTSSLMANLFSFDAMFANVELVRVTNPIGTEHFSFDNIAFSTVTSPSMVLLIGLGLMVMLRLRAKL